MKMRNIRLDMFKYKGGTNCVRVAQVLQGYLDGEIDEKTRLKVANHLSLCRRCGLDAKSYTEIKAALADRSSISSDDVERLIHFAHDIVAGEQETR